MNKTQRIRLSLFLGFTLVLMLPSARAGAQIAVNTCGQPLNNPGVYQLTTDLDCSGTLANGITINSSNVTLHLTSHTVSSTDCDTTKDINGIFVGGAYSGVRIDGGRVSGFNDGIVLSSSYSWIIGMTVEKACTFGIALQGKHNSLIANVIQNNQVEGIGLQNASHSTISSNYIANNTSLGVEISNGSDGNVVNDDIFVRNGITGNQGGAVAVSGGQANRIVSNTFLGNFVGIQLKVPGSYALRNVISETGNTGIWVTSYGNSSTIVDNVVFGSGLADMLDESPACGGNIWKRNTFKTDLVGGTSDGGPGFGCI